MKKQNRKTFFSLIELLVVLAILGALVYLLLPQFQKLQDKANDTLANVNIKSVDHFINTFYAANNGVFCSNLHTGLENQAVGGENAVPLTTLPPVINNLVTAGVAEWAQIRPSCLRSVGIVSLAYGSGQDSKFSLTSFNGSNALNDNDKVLALKVTGDWGTSGPSGTTKISFGGHTLGELVKMAPWKKANLAQDIPHDEQFVIFALFLGPNTQTHSVFDSNGKYVAASKVSTASIKNIHDVNQTHSVFTYPLCFFKLSKSSTTFLGSVGFNKDGTSFITQ